LFGNNIYQDFTRVSIVFKVFFDDRIWSISIVVSLIHDYKCKSFATFFFCKIDDNYFFDDR